MQIHVLVNPRNPTGLMNRIDPFAVHAFKYIKHLSSHYHMIHYGLEGSIVDCEHIDVPPIKGPLDCSDFNRVAGEEIAKRKEPGDIIVSFFGVDNKAACMMNQDCRWVEPSIGYRANGVFSNYRVFTSYANMHFYYGERGMLMSPSWFDAVIPNPFTISEFEYCAEKEDYFLYLGRVVEEKGVALAIQATQRLGKRLIIAGPATNLKHIGFDKIPSHVELVGYVDAEKRKELLKKAKAVLGLTYYVEPFGNMVIEANLCGTPAITTDWGGFTETVLEGQTGFRVRDFKSLLNAIESVDKIDSWECREWGLNFSDEEIHHKHHLYLQKVINSNFYDC